MKHTLLLKAALCAAIMLAATSANASDKEFEKLAKIEGVEHVHIGKFLLSLAVKNGESVNIGDGITFTGNSGDILKKINSIDIFTSEEKDSAEQLSQQVRSILDGNGWESLIDAKDENGQRSKIYQKQNGKHTTIAIFAEGDGEASLVVIEGKLDMAQLMEQMNQENQ